MSNEGALRAHLRRDQRLRRRYEIRFQIGRLRQRAAGASTVDEQGDARTKLIVARTYPLKQAAEALHYLIEERPFGKVVLEV
jgi:NADPH:quinone reductase-like Zn-dependent oxidoreductase